MRRFWLLLALLLPLAGCPEKKSDQPKGTPAESAPEEVTPKPEDPEPTSGPAAPGTPQR